MKLYEIALENLRNYGSKINLIRNFSNLAVSLFQDNTIDFIYIDARHDFCGVYEDLILYFPKLKCNGIMAGHDYVMAKEIIDPTGVYDWGICANGSRILINGGSVKGKFKINKS